MTDKTQLDPSLYEGRIRGYVQKQEQTKVTDGDSSTLANKLICRVDSRDMDDLLKHLVKDEDLKSAGLESREDWLASLVPTKNTIYFATEWVDHKVTLRLGAKNIAMFGNCQLTAFTFDPEHTVMKFHVLAKAASSDAIGKVADVIDGNIVFDFKRAEHWSKQEPIPGTDDGDADNQTDLTDAQKKEIEKAKETANKKNTDKARGRSGKS